MTLAHESPARHADAVVPAPRGRARRVALHGATIVAPEALALRLAALHGERAVASLERLNDLRAAITESRRAVPADPIAPPHPPSGTTA